MAGNGTAHLRERDGLLRIEDVVVEYHVRKSGTVHAVSGVSLDIMKGETLGLVGESGCGKSTLGRAIIQLPPPTRGSVMFEGRELTALQREALRQVRPEMQIIFQDPISSLNPRRKIPDIVREPLKIWGQDSNGQGQAKVEEVLEAVGLDPEAVSDRRPHQFSGGQCQRISIARALILGARLLICDEPVSALDVSVQAQILNLLEDMKAKYGLTMLFISHDLAVVKNISDRVMVMYLGRMCEVGPSEDLYRSPAHPYTAALLAAIPAVDAGLRGTRSGIVAEGELPSALSPPSGCRFRTRCPRAEGRCAEEVPVMRAIGPDHYVACHFPIE